MGLKFKIMKRIFLTLVVVFSLISCDKDDNLTAEQENLILTLDAKKVANEHNRILGEIQSIQAKNSELSLISSVNSINIDMPEEDRQIIVQWVESNSVEDFDDLIMNYISTNLAKNYYDQIDSVIDIDFYNSENLSSSISDILENAEVNVVNEVDIQILRIYGETSIASSKYWFSGDNHRNKIDSKAAASNWVKADGKGAASASITWAVGAALASGPVAPATYFVCVGLGAALASIMS